MKIALLTDGVSPFVMGGMQRHSALLAQHLARLGVQVDLYHTAHDPEAIDRARRLDGFTDEVRNSIRNYYIEYPKRGRMPGHYLRESYNYSKALLAEYRKNNSAVDFIYAQGQTGRAFIEAKRSGVDLPCIGVNAHGYEMFQWAANLRAEIEYWMLRPTFIKLSLNADYVFSFSSKIRDIVEGQLGVPDQRIIEVPNAIDCDWIVTRALPKNGRLRFLFIGRYERRKGVPDILQVFPLLGDESFEFHFVGPIPNASRIEGPSIYYHGMINDSGELQNILDHSDVLVCPSYAEGMPTVILEAMARGLAIIATDVGAVSELVDTDNGVLMAEAGVDPLKIAMEFMLQLNSEQLQKMKQRSLDKVASYTWDRVARMTIDKIHEKLSNQ